MSSHTPQPFVAIRIVKPKRTFDVEGLLRSVGVGTTAGHYQPSQIVFSQGDASDSVMYLRTGAVKLSVLSRGGKEAVVAMLEPGAFFGESALVGPVRHEVATAVTAANVLIIPTQQMIRLLHTQREFADRFIAHTLDRNICIEEDVLDQLFNSSEKRLARVLLLLAHHGKPGTAARGLPSLSQQTLAEMVGTTRSRVNVFMNKFRKLGYIDYNGSLKVHDSLMTVLRDDEIEPRASKTG
jgi:CRP/FNR family transcriptional regulator, cyclic AMP receptor protein